MISLSTNSRSILANPQSILSFSLYKYNLNATLRSDYSRTIHIPDIVSQISLCEIAYAQSSISDRTMHISDIVSQTFFYETTHAQIFIISEHFAKNNSQLAAEQC